MSNLFDLIAFSWIQRDTLLIKTALLGWNGNDLRFIWYDNFIHKPDSRIFKPLPNFRIPFSKWCCLGHQDHIHYWWMNTCQAEQGPNDYTELLIDEI